MIDFQDVIGIQLEIKQLRITKQILQKHVDSFMEAGVVPDIHAHSSTNLPQELIVDESRSRVQSTLPLPKSHTSLNGNLIEPSGPIQQDSLSVSSTNAKERGSFADQLTEMMNVNYGVSSEFEGLL